MKTPNRQHFAQDERQQSFFCIGGSLLFLGALCQFLGQLPCDPRVGLGEDWGRWGWETEQ